MLKSIRWSLFGWHTLILLTVLLAFGSALYYQQQQATLQQVESELVGLARMLAGGVQKQVAPSPSDNGKHNGHDPAFWLAGVRSKGKGSGKSRSAEVVTAVPEKDPVLVLPEQHQQAFHGPRGESYYFILWKGEGEVLAASDSRPEVSLPESLPAGRPLNAFEARSHDDVHEVILVGPEGTGILVGKRINREFARLDQLRWQLIGGGGSLLLLGLIGSWYLSSRAVRPLDKITATAEAISASNLSRRIDVAEMESELGRLAHVLNEAFARLEAAFAQQTRFTADASHELRTPLAVIQTHTELALRKERSAAEYQSALGVIGRAAGRMNTLVDGLLTLARADAGQLVLNRESFDLRDTVEACAALLAPLATGRQVALHLDLEPCPVVADDDRFVQVATNLMTNAIRYNHPEGRVEVQVRARGGSAVLRVADTGPGIAEEHQPHIFERFFRVDKARSREDGGCGLGLAICKEIVQAHGGEISLQSKVGHGTTFEVVFPAGTGA
jgi:heavy metal sensor kinase